MCFTWTVKFEPSFKLLRVCFAFSALPKDIILKFAKKNSSSNREIEKYYGENDVIETKEEYKLIMLEVNVTTPATEPFVCRIIATGGPRNYHQVYNSPIKPDLSNYRPYNGM